MLRTRAVHAPFTTFMRRLHGFFFLMYSDCDVGTRRKTLKDVAIEMDEGTDNAGSLFF